MLFTSHEEEETDMYNQDKDTKLSYNIFIYEYIGTTLQ